MGDFVKGAALESLSEDLRLGVVLHRKIDMFTDTHPLILDLKKQFPSTLRRMSGVILDVYFDYLLCHHWSRFCAEPLFAVLSQFYTELETCEVDLNDRFKGVKASLVEHRWLQNYQNRESFTATCKQIEKRLSKRIIFAEQADAYLKLSHHDIEEQFLAFYPQLMKHAHLHI